MCEGILIHLVLEADKVLQETHIPECLAADHCEVPKSVAYTPSPSRLKTFQSAIQIR